MTPRIKVQRERFDLHAEMTRIDNLTQDIGAIVSFTGLCRSEGGMLSALELEHYPGMAEAELTRIADDAMARWPLQALTLLHRHGVIAAGEEIVLVITAAVHRRAAFEAADFLMDYLKSRAPFWKKEHRADDEPSRWVDAKATDAVALARWVAEN
jgi:molybdopterin synthase catalytic subunit